MRSDAADSCIHSFIPADPFPSLPTQTGNAEISESEDFYINYRMVVHLDGTQFPSCGALKLILRSMLAAGEINNFCSSFRLCYWCQCCTVSRQFSSDKHQLLYISRIA